MAPRHESASTRARGKRPMVRETKTDLAYVHEGRQRARVDMSLFGSLVDHERYCSNFRQRKVIGGQDIDFSSLEGSHIEALFSNMGWLPFVTLHELVYPPLV